MSPTIVLLNGRPVLGIGSPGGSRIPGTVLNGLVSVIDYQQSLFQAVAGPRVISRNEAIANVDHEIMLKCVNRGVLMFPPHWTRFYCFCDRSMREKAWRSRKRVVQAT